MNQFLFAQAAAPTAPAPATPAAPAAPAPATPAAPAAPTPATPAAPAANAPALTAAPATGDAVEQVSAAEVQRLLASDVAMVFDECLPWPCDAARAAKSVETTLAWAKMSLEAPHAPGQLVFGIVQGGAHDPIRRHCAEELAAMDFPGYAIGGVSVGEPEETMYQAVDASVPYLPESKPRYVTCPSQSPAT